MAKMTLGKRLNVQGAYFVEKKTIMRETIINGNMI